MSTRSWLRHSRQIARTERTRNRRQLDQSSTWRAILAIALVSLSIGSGIVAYRVGRSLSRGELILPLGVMQAATTIIIVLSLTTVTHRASVRFERVNFDHL